jgi:hypothetical protein
MCLQNRTVTQLFKTFHVCLETWVFTAKSLFETSVILPYWFAVICRRLYCHSECQTQLWRKHDPVTKFLATCSSFREPVLLVAANRASLWQLSWRILKFFQLTPDSIHFVCSEQEVFVCEEGFHCECSWRSQCVRVGWFLPLGALPPLLIEVCVAATLTAWRMIPAKQIAPNHRYQPKRKSGGWGRGNSSSYLTT